jgi:hypothetical protein
MTPGQQTGKREKRFWQCLLEDSFSYKKFFEMKIGWREWIPKVRFSEIYPENLIQAVARAIVPLTFLILSTSYSTFNLQVFLVELFTIVGPLRQLQCVTPLSSPFFFFLSFVLAS